MILELFLFRDIFLLKNILIDKTVILEITLVKFNKIITKYIKNIRFKVKKSFFIVLKPQLIKNSISKRKMFY